MSSELTHNLGQFDEVIHIIDNARSRAMKAVNAELIQMYWSVGAYLSELCSASSFGDKIIDEVAAYIAQENPNIKGFNRRGLYRMKQFYETYKDDEFVTPLVTQISWTNHLLIMSGSKTADERHFYMALCAKEHYSKRELERQIGTSYYERSMISAKKPMPESVSHNVRESILDTYVLEFLDLPEQFSEKNLRKAIIENLKQLSLLTESFTAEDALRIQPDEEGNRSVDIHAVWNSQDPAAWQMIMVLDANGGTMEGQPSQMYNALTPKYSGGTVYLCGYPTPEREGYHFAGWYLTTDEGDIRVETLPASRFFAEKGGEPDYSQPIELNFVAEWK